MSSIAAGAPFGFGLVLVFLSVMNYLVDSYAIFAASALAANTALRSLFAAIFPLFTTYMYHGLAPTGLRRFRHSLHSRVRRSPLFFTNMDLRFGDGARLLRRRRSI